MLCFVCEKEITGTYISNPLGPVHPDCAKPNVVVEVCAKCFMVPLHCECDQMLDVKSLSQTLLTDGFRNLCIAIGATEDNDEKKHLSRQADIYEEEILRRLGW